MEGGQVAEIATGAAALGLEDGSADEHVRHARRERGKAIVSRAEPVTLPRPVLGLSNISLSFGGVAALRDVDLQVARGEILAVIGPNGAGKSSLLNVVSGLYRPDEGEVWFGEHSFREVPTSKLAAYGVARTFQNLALFKGLSVFDNVLMGLAHRVRSGFLRQVVGSPLSRRIEAENRSATNEIIEFLHLDHVQDSLAGTLPYGVQKRVELARALVGRPSLLLLDEPFAGVTQTEKQELSQHVGNARDSFGAAVVLIEHDIGVVMGLSDRVAVLDHGRKIADGTPEEVRADSAVVDAYLGVDHENHAELAI